MSKIYILLICFFTSIHNTNSMEMVLSPDIPFPAELQEIGKQIIFLHIDTLGESLFPDPRQYEKVTYSWGKKWPLSKELCQYVANVSLVSKKYYDYANKPEVVRALVSSCQRRFSPHNINHSVMSNILGKVAREKYVKICESLFYANLDQIEPLIQKGADINYSGYMDGNPRWPLIVFAHINSIKKVKKALELGADINQNLNQNYIHNEFSKVNYTCLYWAMHHNNKKMVELLLQYEPNDLDLASGIQLIHERKLPDTIIFGILTDEAQNRENGQEQLSSALVKAVELKKQSMSVFLVTVCGAPTQAAREVLLPQIIHSVIDKKEITKEMKLLEILTSSDTLAAVNEYFNDIKTQISSIQETLQI